MHKELPFFIQYVDGEYLKTLRETRLATGLKKFNPLPLKMLRINQMEGRKAPEFLHTEQLRRITRVDVRDEKPVKVTFKKIEESEPPKPLEFTCPQEDSESWRTVFDEIFQRQKEWERLQVLKDAKDAISINDPTFYCDLSSLPQTRACTAWSAWIQQLDKLNTDPKYWFKAALTSNPERETQRDYVRYVAKNLLDRYHQKEANEKCADCGIDLEIPPTLLKPNVAPISPNKFKNLKAEEDFGFIALVPTDPDLDVDPTAVETLKNQSYIAVRVCTPCAGIHRNMWPTSRIRGCYLDGQISGIWLRGNVLQAIFNPLTPEFSTSNQRNYQTVEAVYGKRVKKLVRLRSELRDLSDKKKVAAEGTGTGHECTSAVNTRGAYIRYKYKSKQCALSEGIPETTLSKGEHKGRTIKGVKSDLQLLIPYGVTD